MKFKKGQSLLELVVAIGIFAILVSILTFFILNSLFLGKLGQEFLIANSLAEEGLEAAKSIRDNNFNDLTAGNHGLAISEGRWVFQGTEEDLSQLLREGRRIVEIQEIDSNRKRVISKVRWQFNSLEIQEIRLITHFTNW